MKKFITALSIFIFTSVSFAQECTDMVYAGKFPVTAEQSTIHCYSRFVIGYSTARKSPLWVAELLTVEHLEHDGVARTNNFRPDPSFPRTLQSSPSQYVGTQFDKGHMAAFDNVKDDVVAAVESFYMTNIVPQESSNNRGAWKMLETRVRHLAISRGKVFVISGPVFIDPVKTLSDGTNIPTKLYKIILVPHTGEAYSFILPNEKTSMPLVNYVTTLYGLQEINKNVKLIPIQNHFRDMLRLP